MIKIKKGDISIEVDTLPEITRLYNCGEVAELFHISTRALRRWREGRGSPKYMSGLDVIFFMLEGVKKEEKDQAPILYDGTEK